MSSCVSMTAARAIDQAHFEQMLSALTSEQRIVFTLHYRDGKSYQEITDATGVKFGTVKKHLSKAMAHLHALLSRRPFLSNRSNSSKGRSMKTHVNDNRTPPKIPPIVLEAADWLICLKVPGSRARTTPTGDVAARDHAFLIWNPILPCAPASLYGDDGTRASRTRARHRDFQPHPALHRHRACDDNRYRVLAGSGPTDAGPLPEREARPFAPWAVAAILVAVVCIGLGRLPAISLRRGPTYTPQKSASNTSMDCRMARLCSSTPTPR